jgi:hypothetical protein
MFKLKLKKEKTAISLMMKINKDLIMGDGVVCSLHSGAFAFCAIFDDAIAGDLSMRDCSFLDNVRTSRVINEMIFDIESSKFKVNSPYRCRYDMPVKEDAFSIPEAVKRLEIISEFADESNEVECFRKSDGQEVDVVKVEIDNELFTDMLKRLGSEENVLIEAGESLKISNSKSWASYKLPSITKNVSVTVTEDTFPVLEQAFIEEEQIGENRKPPTSSIYLADKSFLLIMNKAYTLINSMS